MGTEKAKLNLVWPVSGQVTQGFGENAADYTRFGYPGHNGLDIYVPSGTPVAAALPGKVAEVSWQDGGYGCFVKLDHGGGIYTYYAHLMKATIVRPGLVVEQGEEIGLSDSTGFSTGPHLHFGLKAPGGPMAYKGFVDPLPHLPDQGNQAGGMASADETGAIDLGGMRFKVTTDVLYVRSGPGTGFPKIGQLAAGQIITGLRLHCNDAWVEFAEGKFCALAYSGTDYLKPVKGD